MGAIQTADAPQGRFSSLRDPRYRVLWLSGTFVFLATHAQQIARGWLAKELTGSNAGIGGVFLGFGVAMFLTSLFSGVLADRFSKRNVLMIAQGLILAGAVMIAVAENLDVLRYWMLIVASIFHGAGMAAMAPARISYTAELVEPKRLPNALVLTQMSVNSTRILGPAIAGALIGIQTIGTGGVYIITSTLIVVSIYWSARLPNTPPRPAAEHDPPLRAFVEGVRYVKRDHTLAVWIIVANTIAIVALPYNVLLPNLSAKVFDAGASGYGTMSTMSAVGALATSFWIAGRISNAQIHRTQTGSGLMLGVALLGLAVAPSYLWALVAIGVLGGMASAFQVSNNALISGAVDHEFHGRVQALVMIGFAASSMASLPFGMLADRFGLRPTIAGMGVCCLAVMGAALLAPRRAERARAAADASNASTAAAPGRHGDVLGPEPA
jgi:MFS family permease